ncbi:MAG: hypothetical protein MZV64_13510 [Ignavibacteriales bacterium]|nr:hypothetical protein [Ignavibacteriales bacterium]
MVDRFGSSPAVRPRGRHRQGAGGAAWPIAATSARRLSFAPERTPPRPDGDVVFARDVRRQGHGADRVIPGPTTPPTPGTSSRGCR